MLNAMPRDVAIAPPAVANLVGTSTLLDYLGAAVIGVAVDDGRVRPLNARAASLLAGRRGLAVTTGGLTAVTAEDTRALRQAIATATADAGRTVALTVSAPDGGPDDRRLHLLVTQVGGGEGGGGRGADGPRVVVLAVEPDSRPCPDPAHLRGWFGLSRREAELAALLAGGAGLEEAARRLGVAVGTARTHLKRVFAKTGTAGQGRLVSLIRAYPALADVTGRS